MANVIEACERAGVILPRIDTMLDGKRWVQWYEPYHDLGAVLGRLLSRGQLTVGQDGIEIGCEIDEGRPRAYLGIRVEDDA